MDNDCAKLSGADTTGLSVCEDSVTSSLWSGKTFPCLMLGSDFDQRYSQKAAGPFRDGFFTGSKETPKAREIGVISSAQQQELSALGVFPATPCRVGGLGLGMCSPSELGMGPSHPCGSVSFLNSLFLLFLCPWADSSFI